MKKMLIPFGLFLFFGCSVFSIAPKSNSYSSFDFRKFGIIPKKEIKYDRPLFELVRENVLRKKNSIKITGKIKKVKSLSLPESYYFLNIK